jgi:hypothetical protein
MVLKKILSLLIVSICLSSVLSGKIIEVENLILVKQEAEQLSQNDLMIFDADDTLFEKGDAILKNNIESRKLFKEKFSSQLDKIDPRTKKLFSIITITTPIEPLDPIVYTLVEDLQKKKIPVIVLTAVSAENYGLIPDMKEWRLYELKKLGFDFSTAFPKHEYLDLKREKDEWQVSFKKGVIFSSKTPKGEALKRFLEALEWYPHKVILVDDRLENHHSLEAVLATMGIEYIGFYYRASEQVREGLDKNLAEFQLRHLLEHEEWLTDSIAKKLFGCD